MWWTTIPRKLDQIQNDTWNFTWNVISTGNILTIFLSVDFLCEINLVKQVFTNKVCAKTDFSRMLPPELSLTTKPTESQSGDLGEIHRNTSCVIRQKFWTGILFTILIENIEMSLLQFMPIFDTSLSLMKMAEQNRTNVPEVAHTARNKWFLSKFLAKTDQLANCKLRVFFCSILNSLTSLTLINIPVISKRWRLPKILWNRSNHPQASIYPSN